jgi:hypothetical protein
MCSTFWRDSGVYLAHLVLVYTFFILLIINYLSANSVAWVYTRYRFSVFVLSFILTPIPRNKVIDV